MSTVTLKGNPVALKGEIPTEGHVAQDFTFVKSDLSEGKLSDTNGKVRVVLAVPSLDTGVCATETRRFNQELEGKEGVSAIVVSKDLPFAMSRFCETQGITNVVSGSDQRRGELGNKYNIAQIDGPLEGLLARAVWVIDRDDNIVYSELVPEITQEPDYDKAMAAINSVL